MALPSSKVTEMTYSGDLKGWIDDIIRTEGLPFLHAKVEKSLGGKRADLLLFDKAGGCVLIIEVKRPDIEATSPEVVKQAAGYARKFAGSGLKYYATHNVNILVLYDAITDAKVEQFAITYVRSLDEYERKEEEIKERFKKVLVRFAKLLKGEPPKPIDESIIEILHNYISGIVNTTGLVEHQVAAYTQDADYRRKFDGWLKDKAWVEPRGDRKKLEDYCTVLSKQFLYIYVNKVLFYYVLRVKFPRDIPDLTLSPDLSGDGLYQLLDTYFGLATKASKDYETVFKTNFVDRAPLPSDVVVEIVKLTHYLSGLEYSTIGYDITGKVFEKLIPLDERHVLGQYFTPSNVTDLGT